MKQPGPERTGARSGRKALGNAMMLVGAVLWLLAVLVDAATIAVIIPILMLMGGALLSVTGGAIERNDG